MFDNTPTPTDATSSRPIPGTGTSEAAATRRTRDRVALVTGAAGDMGRAHCVRLASEGIRVIAVGRTQSDHRGDLTATVEQVRAAGTDVYPIRADVADRAELEEQIGSAVAAAGGLDFVVANAAIYQPTEGLECVSDEIWHSAINVNLTGVWNTIMASLPFLTREGARSAIVVVGSTSAVRGHSGAPQYSASKHGLSGLVRSLVRPLGEEGIRINMVHPGAVGTSLIRNPDAYARLCPGVVDPTEEDMKPVLAAQNVLGVPWVEPEDVSESVAFLVSERARYITGAELVVDAGALHR